MVLKRLIICFLLLIFILFKAQSQTKYNVDSISVEKVITSIDLNYLGISLYQERKLKSITTLKYGIGGHYSFYGTGLPLLGTRFINVIDEAFGRDYYTSNFTPYVFAESRRYFTLLKRYSKHKKINNNSGSYIALFAEAPLYGGFLEKKHLEKAYPVGLKIGMRRNLGKAIYFDISGAFVAKISKSNTYFMPRLDISIAYKL